MFNEKEFIDSIRKKAKAKGLVEETEKELELFARYEEIEYLFVVNEFVKRIRKECVPGTMLRQAGASSYVAYLLGFHNINPKGCHLFNTLFFSASRLNMISATDVIIVTLFNQIHFNKLIQIPAYLFIKVF